MDKAYKLRRNTYFKKMAVCLILTLVLVIISGCKEEEADFMQFDESITNMEVSERTTGKSVILNVAQTDYLWSKLKSIQFAQGDAYVESDDYLYDIEVYDASEYIGDLKIIDASTIEYIGFYYTDPASSIDIAYIEGLLENSSSTDDEGQVDDDDVDTDIDADDVEDQPNAEDVLAYEATILELMTQLSDLEQQVQDLENAVEERDIRINQLENTPTTEYVLSDTQIAGELDDNMDAAVDAMMSGNVIPIYEMSGFTDEATIFDSITDWYEAYKSSKEKVLLALSTPYNSGNEVVVNCLEFRSLPPNVEAEDMIGYSPIVQVQFRLIKSGNNWDINTYIDQF